MSILILASLRVRHGRLQESTKALTKLNKEPKVGMPEEELLKELAACLEYDDLTTQSLALLRHATGRDDTTVIRGLGE